MLKNHLAAALVAACVLPAVVQAAEVPPKAPYDVDITVGGKVQKDDSQRAEGIEVLVPFTYADKAYKVGDQITDLQLARQIVAYLKTKPGVASGSDQSAFVGPIDPQCSQCAPITVRRLLETVLTTPVCPKQSAMGQTPPKPAACTSDEEKVEQDPQAMAGRADVAQRLRNGENVVFTDREVAKLKDLATTDFVPAVVAQIDRAIDPNWKPTEWKGE